MGNRRKNTNNVTLQKLQVSIDQFFPFLRTPAKSPHLNARTTEHLSQDPVMAKLIERIGPIYLKARRVPVFQSLVQSIIYQQLSGKAADTIFNRFVALKVREVQCGDDRPPSSCATDNRSPGVIYPEDVRRDTSGS